MGKEANRSYVWSTGEGRFSPKPDFKRLQYARLQDIRRRSYGDVRCRWKLALRPDQEGPCSGLYVLGTHHNRSQHISYYRVVGIHGKIGHQDNRVEEWTRPLETTTTTPCHRGHGGRVTQRVGLSWVTVRAARHGPVAYFQRDSGQKVAKVRHAVFDAPIESDGSWLDRAKDGAGRCSYVFWARLCSVICVLTIC